MGQTDESLSEAGVEKIKKKMQEGFYPKADLVASSTMKRCVQTATLIYGQSPAFRTEKWKEIDFGRWEGKHYLELSEDPYYQEWIDSGGLQPFPEGESRAAFVERCREGFLEFCSMLNAYQPVPERVALIVHGGTMMAILSAYCGKEYYQFQCKNGEGYQCKLHIQDRITMSLEQEWKGSDI